MTDNNHKTGNRQQISLLRASIGGIVFVVLLLVFISLDNKLETIEDEVHKLLPLATIGIVISESQIVYAPVYTYIETGKGDVHRLEAVLGIRNSDPEHSITINSARFYNGKGNLVREYFDKGPVQLAPLEARTLTMRTSDLSRVDAAANFIVAWSAEVPVYEPIIDAVMFGFIDGQSITFKSVGRPLAQRIEQTRAHFRTARWIALPTARLRTVPS